MTLNLLTRFFRRFRIFGILGFFLVLVCATSSLPVAANTAGAGGAAGNAGGTTQQSGAGGLSAFQIFRFKCIFPIPNPPQGQEPCTGSDALLGSIRDALLSLAPALATLVFIWGGYQYFFGGITGKQNGLNAIKSAVIGLLLVFSADFIINTFLPSVVSNGEISAAPFKEIIENIADALIQIAVAVAVIVIIYGGYQYMFTGIAGKENGRRTIINGVIGLAVILSASAIANLVREILVVDDLGNYISDQDDVNRSIGSLGLQIANIFVVITNNILIPVAGAVTVFFVILAGYKWIASPSIVRAGEAKQALINALIGFIIVLLAVTIVQLIYYFVPNFVGNI